jgi:hypothetical protein
MGIKKYEMDDTWTCKLVIKKEFGGIKLVDKEADFDASDKLFKTLVTPTESASLEVGEYMLTFAFENTEQLFKKEVQYKLRITPSGDL